VRRSVLLTVIVHCPHFGRPVAATRNDATDRLVACADADKCRDAHPDTPAGEHDRPYPRGCPVFPSLAK
jgi:hypothetical protein